MYFYVKSIREVIRDNTIHIFPPLKFFPEFQIPMTAIILYANANKTNK